MYITFLHKLEVPIPGLLLCLFVCDCDRITRTHTCTHLPLTYLHPHSHPHIPLTYLQVQEEVFVESHGDGDAAFHGTDHKRNRAIVAL